MAEDSSEIVREAAETVGFRNVKDTEVTSGANSFYAGMQMADAVSHQRSMNLKREAQTDIGTAIAAKAAELIMNTSVREGAADDILTAILAKVVQGTPPPTNLPTQGQ